MTPSVHAILIAFHNPAQTLLRWRRDVLPALEYAGADHVVTVVDNSPEPSAELRDAFGGGYLWQGGRNPMYGPSINLAVPRAASEFVLYACSRHGRMVHPGWVADLLAPFGDPNVVLAGHLRGSNSPNGVAHDLKADWVKEHFYFVDGNGDGYVPQHVQGGVFAARASFLKDNPYVPPFDHMYTDHFITWTALKAGHACADVPSVLSVWRERVHNVDHIVREKGLRYYHDASEEPR